MQTYKNRVANHQRSLSFCNYDEFRRARGLTGTELETEFRQRRPLITDTEGSVDQSSVIESDNIPATNNIDPESNNLVKPAMVDNGVGGGDDCQKVTDEDGKKIDKFSPLSPLLLSTEEQAKAVAAAAAGSNPSVMVKGHRRSLSLRQRFEFGYEFIVSEFEYAREVAGKTVIHASETVWKTLHFSSLPNWMQDNEYLHWGHRPPLPSLWECAKSIFRVHTETGNIWTHGIGALLFLILFIYEFVTISAHKTSTDRLVLAIYFCGIILCLIFSTMFHTFSCYASPKVIKIFSKLDYCGISLQIIGSMIPALYYGFYENLTMFKVYISFGVILCVLSIVVSMWDKFGEPEYRPFRAMVFLTFGLSNVIPGIHWYIILDSRLVTAFCLFIFQGILYVIGSLLYANRIPERFFPGKCDYLFQSHQIFHVLVVLAALVHLNGINSMADFHMHIAENEAAAAAAAAASVAAASSTLATPTVINSLADIITQASSVPVAI